MGAWGELAFDNDEANDWAYELDGRDADRGLALVESALTMVELHRDDNLDAHAACNALAACEILARLQGNPGYQNAHTEKVDAWVVAHPVKPSPALLQRAASVIDRILGEDSELRELWDETGERLWHDGVADLRQRLGV